MLPILFDRSLLRKRRHRFRHSAVQFLNQIVAAELVDRLGLINRPLQTMLIHGAASSRLKADARRTRPSATIFASDVLNRPGIDFVFDDELLPVGPQNLEAFIYLLGLESTNDVPGVLAQIRHSLKPDGVFLAALLGGDTLRELKQAWLSAETAVTGGATPRVAPFVDLRQWGALLQRAGFALPVIDSDRRTVRYDNPLALMHDLRNLGLANSLVERTRRPLSRRLLEAVMEAYTETSTSPEGRISATFEIIYLTGWAPHESQQKPLRPGSAATRLADALGVEEKRIKRE
jgi:hypothetical protein